jgi:hypothetical protein
MSIYIFGSCDNLGDDVSVWPIIMQSELYQQLADYENQQKVAVEIQNQVLVPEPTEAHAEATSPSVEQLRQVFACTVITNCIILVSISHVRK